MKTIAILLALAFAVPASFIACDRTVETDTKTSSTDGKTSVDKKTVTENPNNGETTVTKEKKEVSNNP